MSGSSYQGSQAFNLGPATQESVNPNTGTLSLRLPVALLRGVNSDCDLNIALSHGDGGGGVLGLPTGWSFDVPYVDGGKVLHMQGKTLLIDPDWRDEHEYASGLRYVNDHGVRFTHHPEEPSPPSGQGAYLHRMVHGDGSCDFFDSAGKLIEHADAFGNHLRFTYLEAGGVHDNALETVVDSFAQVIRFDYSGPDIGITLPSGARTEIITCPDGVDSVTNALGYQTVFRRGVSAGRSVITEIDYPNGLATRVEYGELGALAADGSNMAFPAVSKLMHLGANERELDRVVYQFGTETGGASFTGANIGLRLSPDGDGLMDSSNVDYRYDVLEQRLNPTDKVLSARRATFNYLHQAVEEVHYLIEAGGAMVEARKTTYEYPELVEKHARTVNFNRPTEIVEWVFAGDSEGYVPRRRTKMAHGLYGEPRSQHLWLYDRASKKFLSQSKTLHEFEEIAGGGLAPLVTTLIDEVTGRKRKVSFESTPDKKCIASATLWHAAKDEANWHPWKTKRFEHDDKGRTTRWRLTWTEGCQEKAGTIDETWGEELYHFDPATGILTVTHRDAEGGEAKVMHDMKAPEAPVVERRYTSGEIRRYTHDLLSRVVSAEDATGGVTHHAYEPNPANGSLTVRVTGPAGYVTETVLDELGRQVRSLDNGDPTSDGSQVTRVLEERVYDALGRMVERTDELLRKSTFEHDGLGRIAASTDAFGNVTSVVYDDALMEARISLNDDLRLTRSEDGAGRIRSITAHPDSAAAGSLKPTTVTYEHDGFGQMLSETRERMPKASLIRTTLDLDPEGRIRTASYGSGKGDRVEIYPVLDLLGNVISRTKTTTYADGRNYEHEGNRFTYDRLGRIVAIENPLGAIERFGYRADGLLASRKRFDGGELTYDYDNSGRPARIAWDGGVLSYDYFPNGRIKSVSDGSHTLSYEYFNGGALKSVAYPDGRRQSYEVDGFDRVTAQTDASGNRTEIGYDSLGRIIERRQGSEAVHYQYGEANHAKGVLVGAEVGETKRVYRFDGWGALAGMEVGAGGRTLLSASYRRDEALRLTGLDLHSDVCADPSVNRSRSFAYDGLGQLAEMVTEATDGGRWVQGYRFDGNGNVIETDENGTKTAFAFDAADRPEMDGVTFDANGRMTTSGRGANYVYDALDRLIEVRNAKGETLARHRYLPNGALMSSESGAATRHFYFDGGTVNAVNESTGDGASFWTSYLVGDGERFAALESGKPPKRFLTANTSTCLSVEGDKASGIDYDAFGAVRGNEAPAFGWNQEGNDPASGLIYLRSRWYDPCLGRFLTTDRLLRDNRYAFCDGDPINRADPTGENAEPDFMTSLGIFVASTIVAMGVSITAGFATGKILSKVAAGMSVAKQAYITSFASSSLGSIGGDVTTAALTKDGHVSGADWGRIAVNAVIGGVSGMSATFVGHHAGWAVARRMMNPNIHRLVVTQPLGVMSHIREVERMRLIFDGLAGGATGATVAAALGSIANGSEFISGGTAGSILWAMVRDASVGRFYRGWSVEAPGAYVPLSVTSVPVATNAWAAPRQGERPADHRPAVSGGDGSSGGGGSATVGMPSPRAGGAAVAPGPAGDTLAGAPRFAEGYLTPVTGRSLVDFLDALDPLAGALGGPDPLKVMACFGSMSDGRLLADSVGRAVFAGYGMIDVG